MIRRAEICRAVLSVATLATVGVLIANVAGCKCVGDRKGKATPTAQPSTDDPVPVRGDGTIKLVVLLVIDQLPSWTFTRDAGQLKGGLGRLLSQSVYYPDAEIPYANTYTAPGHASMATGASPRTNGILANAWMRAGTDAVVAATADPKYPLYDANAKVAGTKLPDRGASSVALKVEGVADVLSREKPAAKSVAIGLKQRATILVLGKRPSRAVWYEPAQAAMTTSTFYGEYPAWVEAFNRENPMADRFSETWTISDHEFLKRYLGSDDDGIGEGRGAGLDTTFPHDITGASNKPKAVRMMPGSIKYLFDAAEAAIDGEKLGQRGERDLLAVTVSTHDYVGHFWGQESWERFDSLRQIDAALDQFLTKLDGLYGTDGYVVVVTSDHGAVPLVELSQKRGRVARRIGFGELVAAVSSGLESVLGKSKNNTGLWVAGYAANSVYLSREFFAKPEPLRAKAIRAATASLAAVDNVALAAPTIELSSDLGGDCTKAPTAMARLACESIQPEESGHLTVLPDRYSLFQSPSYMTGTGHGTPSAECRQVPILVSAPGLPARTEPDRVSFLQLAPTLSSFLDITPPAAAHLGLLPLEPDTPGATPH